jgi:RNA ligase (TIGR02306 family)
MRKLVTVRKIDAITKIDGASFIVTAHINGWTVVIKKGEFSVGDNILFCEIDSWIPHSIKPELSKGKTPRIFNGTEGERLRTIKLKGQLSQGLVLPISLIEDSELYKQTVNAHVRRNRENSILGYYNPETGLDDNGDAMYYALSRLDVSDLLGVQKYEAPIPAELSGQVKGNFPAQIKKTDQERCQNMNRDIFVDNADARYEISMKLDGTSFTAFAKDDIVGICSRNWELKLDDPKNENNSLVRMFIDSGLQATLHNYGSNIAVQGELTGAGIQGNKEGFKAHKLFVFDIFDIDNGCYLPPPRRIEIMHDLWNSGLNKDMVDHVPIIAMDMSLEDLGIFSMADLLEFSKGPSINAIIREGVVFKRMDGTFSFKVINNDWLLKHE